ncbi:MAG TPA: (2Fe-2S) ferredoxin domain-containing protein [Bacillota bacterium]|nr:(2Fe-2S) ferredoxin domain-containing protein [Candidatus Fermentithermobacillaceae bacterium]HOB30677.1 (2Fe-2S) ferredoxin domain-containing protein [Bacillota bacterium]HOK64533.1 (2Fe-2S) ferredoxin domain-containing protein [Bacillota bacterium]HOL12046.1 (2Fe-2S) ferredoxin domain-containing protein [Bacillota bacterium]HOQ03118.1 (2Fe-2S) ferredoxin domain-containing protein [Bacillota bacterium]
MKSIEELERIKEETLQEIRLRSASGSPRIVVGMGTCGIAAGARDTMLAVLDELRKRKKLDVTVTETGCIGLCSQEPIVTVEIPGEPEVVYGKVDPDKARQIVVSHIINHKPVEEWVINVEEQML